MYITIFFVYVYKKYSLYILYMELVSNLTINNDLINASYRGYYERNTYCFLMRIL